MKLPYPLAVKRSAVRFRYSPPKSLTFVRLFFMKYYTYILVSELTGKFYIGQTQDLDKRLLNHNAGYSRYTKKFVPWKIYAYKFVESRADALRLEKKLKNLKSRNRILLFIEKQQFIQLVNEL